MKKIWLLCLLLIIPFCFIGCSQNEYITIITRGVYEFEADKDYIGGVSIYFLIDGNSTYCESKGLIFYEFSSNKTILGIENHRDFSSLIKGDRIRFSLSYSGVDFKTANVNKIRIVSNEDESIYYEQEIN